MTSAGWLLLLLFILSANIFALDHGDNGTLLDDMEDAESTDVPENDVTMEIGTGMATDATTIVETSLLSGKAEYSEHLNRDMVGVLLQTTGKASTESYVDSGMEAFGNITKCGVCLRFRMLHGAQPATLFSYTDGVALEELNIAIKHPEADLLVTCCYYHVHHYFDIPVKLFRWHHMCVSLDLRGNTLEVVFDGKLLKTTAGRPESEVDINTITVKGQGRFIIGQNINPDTSWDITQTFHGDIADFIFYEETIPLEDMMMFTTCKQYSYVGATPLFQFNRNMTRLTVSGDSKVTSIKMLDTCVQKEGHLTLFSEKLGWFESYSRCEYFSGTMAVPKDEDENDYVFETFVPMYDQCMQGWNALYWLGIEGNITGQFWTNSKDDAVVNYGHWLESWEYPTEKYPCAVVGAINLAKMWFNAECNTLTCPICNFTAIPVLRIRGLCKESRFDRIYSLYGYDNGRPVFEGLFFSRIFWDDETWVLENRHDATAEARMIEKRPKGYPLGLADWATRGDGCGKKEQQYLLTLCGRSDFTCSDGSCVEITKRCDQVTDCPDNSDELNCQILMLPSGYSPDLPPPTLDGSPLRLLVSLEMTTVRKFDLVGFMVEIDVIQRITWRDARLTFSNLRLGPFSNLAKVTDDVWRPLLRLQDGSESPTNILVRSNVFQVNREAPALKDDDTRTGEDRLYTGSEHRIRMLQIYTVGFMCQFSLQMYPFDIQSCIFSLNVTNMHDFILDKGGVVYSGERELLEYELLDEKMTTSVEGVQGLQVSMRFKNRYGYYIGNAIIPSLFMVIICYLTFFYAIDDFMDRAMISLTSLLVLASLFSQTSQSIPKTAYLKLIDVWYITVIAIDFLIIVTLVLIENLRLRKLKIPYKQTKVIRVSPGSLLRKNDDDDDDAPLARLVNHIAIILFPTTVITFCIIFFMHGFLKFYIE